MILFIHLSLPPLLTPLSPPQLPLPSTSFYVLQERDKLVAQIQRRADQLKKDQKRKEALSDKIKVLLVLKGFEYGG